MKLNLNQKVCGLDGKPLLDGGEPVMLNQLVANALARATENSIKFFDWATKLYNGETIEVDNADRKTLEKFITNDGNMRNLAKGPALKILDNLKEEKSKKGE